MRNSRLARRSARRGFSLIELLVAIVILVIISTFGVVASARTYRRGAIDSERDTLVGALTKARSSAMANQGGSAHGLAVTDDDYVVFRGGDYDSRDPDFDELVPRTTGLTVAGATEVVFTPIEGSVSAPETFTVQSEVKTLTVGVNEEGRIDW